MNAIDETASLGATQQQANNNRLLRQLAGYVPVNLAQIFASFGAIYLFTRILGAEAYGRYALILTAVNFLFILGFTWIEASAHRFYAPMAAQGRTADLIASLRWLLLVTIPLVILASIAAITIAPMEDQTRIAAVLAATYLVVRGCVRIGTETHRAAQNVVAFSIIETIQISLGFIAGACLAVWTPLKEAAPFAGLLGAALVALMLDWPKHSRTAKGGKINHNEARGYATFGWSVVVILIVEQLLAFSDRFLIAGYLGEASAGAFAAAFGLAPRILDILFIWTGRTAAPLNTSVYETQGASAAQALATKYFATILGLTLPAAVGLALVARPIADIMVVDDMRADVSRLIPWLAFSGLLAGFVTYYFGESYRLGRKMTLCASLLAIGGFVNIGLNILLLPRMGLIGSGIASVSGYLVAATLLATFSKRALHFPIPVEDALRTVGAVLLMGVTVYLLPSIGGVQELALKAIVGGTVYAMAALALNVGGSRALIDRLVPKRDNSREQPAEPRPNDDGDGKKTDA